MTSKKRNSMQNAIKHIHEKGILLVFPMNNRPEPLSIWSQFYPRSKMRWEWDIDGDDRVGQMWLLMKKLSDCREVVYSKWYQGRATFFSKELFTAMLSLFHHSTDLRSGLDFQARELLDLLEESSPLSTKELKKMTGLQGKLNEPTYQRAMKALFQRMLIVGYGEVEDGAFPSLAVGATKTLYEDLWEKSLVLEKEKARKVVDKYLKATSPERKFFDKLLQSLKT